MLFFKIYKYLFLSYFSNKVAASVSVYYSNTSVDIIKRCVKQTARFRICCCGLLWGEGEDVWGSSVPVTRETQTILSSKLVVAEYEGGQSVLS